jgi:hypothetical protein
MNKKSLGLSLLVISVMLGTALARAQNAPATACAEKSPPCTPELTKAILHQIQGIEKRMVTIAEDFPGDLYNTYRPKGDEEVRSAAEILLHVAQQNAEVAFEISNQQGQKALAAAGNIADAKTFVYVSKQDTVTKVKDSFAAVRKAIQDNPDPKNIENWLYVVAHGNGHFGNLVTYYRNNGLVPPSSRQ